MGIQVPLVSPQPRSSELSRSTPTPGRALISGAQPAADCAGVSVPSGTAAVHTGLRYEGGHASTGPQQAAPQPACSQAVSQRRPRKALPPDQPGHRQSDASGAQGHLLSGPRIRHRDASEAAAALGAGRAGGAQGRALPGAPLVTAGPGQHLGKFLVSSASLCSGSLVPQRPFLGVTRGSSPRDTRDGRVIPDTSVTGREGP